MKNDRSGWFYSHTDSDSQSMIDGVDESSKKTKEKASITWDALWPAGPTSLDKQPVAADRRSPRTECCEAPWQFMPDYGLMRRGYKYK